MSDNRKHLVIAMMVASLIGVLAAYFWQAATPVAKKAAEQENPRPAQDPNISKRTDGASFARVPAMVPGQSAAPGAAIKERKPDELAREVRDAEPWPGEKPFQRLDRWQLAPRLSAVTQLEEARKTTVSGYAIKESSHVMRDEITAGGERPVVIDTESQRLGVVVGTIVVRLVPGGSEAQSIADEFQMKLKSQRPELNLMVLEPAHGTRLSQALARIRKDPRVRLAYLEVLTGDRRPR